MKRFLLLGLFFLQMPFAGCQDAAPAVEGQQEVVDPVKQRFDQVEAKLQELIDEKNFRKARIYRLELNADRWQFNSSTYQDDRRAWKQVEEDKRKIREMDVEIAQLELEKAEILKEHPEFAGENG